MTSLGLKSVPPPMIMNVLMKLQLYFILQIFPGDLLEHNYTNPSNSDELIARSEVERRRDYFERLEGTMVGARHPCVLMIKQCLHNSPSRRPTAEQLIATLEGMREDIEGLCGAVARADAVRQVVMMKAFIGTQSTVREKTNELAVKDEIIHQLRLQIQVGILS
jgi:hypothetical protein